MAKFKVGDKVEITAGSKSGKLGTVESSAPGPMGGEMYHVRLEDGSLTDAAERNLLAANSASLASTNAVVQNAINARRAKNASSDVMVKAWEDFVEDAGRFIRSTSLSRLVGLAAKTPDDEAGKRVRDAIDAATSEISAVTDKIQNIIRKYGSRI